LGGVTINVEKAINDSLYPDDQLEGYEPFYIKAGEQKMDGETALKYARSRQTTSDFDRSRRQQKLMVAVKEKAFSLGILANPAKITEIVQIIGKHIKTDIQPNEIQELAKRYKEIKSENTESLVIDNSINGPLVSTSQYGSYGLIPSLGLDEFDEIHGLAHEIIQDPKIIEEKATIDIQYTKSRKTEATEIIDKLTKYGYTISDGGYLAKTAEEADLLIVRDKKSPFTEKYLENRFNEFEKKTEKASTNLSDFTISLGE